MVSKALTRSTNNAKVGMPCCLLRSKALFIVCCASWQPMCPNWDLSPISSSLFSRLFEIMILMILAVVSFKQIPLELFRSSGSPFLLYNILGEVTCQESKLVSWFLQNSWMILVRKSVASSCRLLTMFVERLVAPGALPYVIFFITDFISSFSGVSPNSFIVP